VNEQDPPRLRATRPHPQQEQRTRQSSPLGGALGCLTAGIWCLLFVQWFRPGEVFGQVALGLGFVLIVLGLVLLGSAFGEWIGRKRP
jgi:hypothetical protein